MSASITDLYKRIRRRKHLRDEHRAKHQRRRTLREIRAIQHLRAAIDHIHREPRVMFDDTSVELIPKAARAVAGYVNGNYTTWPAVLRLFPHARHISIAVTSSVHAHCLDVEPGDATNADAAAWFRRFKERERKNHTHAKPIFYTSASNVAALVSALRAAGIARHEYIVWAAHYNGHRHVCSPKACGYPAAEATQWTSSSHSRSLDESKLTPAFWQRG
jgi:hypothetical protein